MTEDPRGITVKHFFKYLKVTPSVADYPLTLTVNCCNSRHKKMSAAAGSL